jgi:HlyD family secretion protein
VARAQHEAAKAAVAQAQRDRDRAADLAGRGLVADEAREKADLALTTAQQELDAAGHRASAAAHEVEMARAAIAEGPVGTRAIELKAPASGCVLRRAEESERVILAGSTVMEIGDVCALEIVVDLLSADAVHVAKGDTIEVRGWGRDSTLVALVDRVEPSGFTKTSALGVEEQRVNVVAVLSNPPRELGDRFRVGVRVVLWRGENLLRAPRGAVFEHGGRWAAFVALNGRARETPVTLGHRGDDFVEIQGGLAEGDAVVLYPDERVKDGLRVRARENR